jgi:hypothetical protein
MDFSKKINEKGINWESNMLSHALSYAKKFNWYVIPLHTPVFTEEGKQATKCSCGKDCGQKTIGKHPRFHETLLPHGLRSASNDVELIRKWWEMWPDANIGIITGERSKLAVIDADEVTGRRTLMSMPEVPYTASVQTGSGIHYYFLHPGGKVKNCIGVLRGLDSRGDGGYVCAPPSIHYKGFRYEWLDAADLAMVPEWWMELLNKPEEEIIKDDTPYVDVKITDPSMQAYGRAALQDELTRLWNCPKGMGIRNKTLYDATWAMFQLVAAGALEESTVESLIRQAAIDGMEMKPIEVDRTMRSAKKWGLQHARNLENKNGFNKVGKVVS